MADTWDLIADLYKIALMDGEGTAWQQTETRRGQSMTRTIRPLEATIAALELMKQHGGRPQTRQGADRPRTAAYTACEMAQDRHEGRIDV